MVPYLHFIMLYNTILQEEEKRFYIIEMRYKLDLIFILHNSWPPVSSFMIWAEPNKKKIMIKKNDNVEFVFYVLALQGGFFKIFIQAHKLSNYRKQMTHLSLHRYGAIIWLLG